DAGSAEAVTPQHTGGEVSAGVGALSGRDGGDCDALRDPVRRGGRMWASRAPAQHREAVDAEVVRELTHVFGPVEVRTIRLRVGQSVA
ncbi:hypothetical protein DF186_17985, partial [Enterococcus hirae]